MLEEVEELLSGVLGPRSSRPPVAHISNTMLEEMKERERDCMQVTMPRGWLSWSRKGGDVMEMCTARAGAYGFGFAVHLTCIGPMDNR